MAGDKAYTSLEIAELLENGLGRDYDNEIRNVHDCSLDPVAASQPGEPPQPQERWYTREELHDALIARNYELKIANELAGWIADQLEFAYRKGKQHTHSSPSPLPTYEHAKPHIGWGWSGFRIEDEDSLKFAFNRMRDAMRKCLGVASPQTKCPKCQKEMVANSTGYICMNCDVFGDVAPSGSAGQEPPKDLLREYLDNTSNPEALIHHHGDALQEFASWLNDYFVIACKPEGRAEPAAELGYCESLHGDVAHIHITEGLNPCVNWKAQTVVSASPANSRTYGDLPGSIRNMIEPHEWDNRNISEQRDYALDMVDFLERELGNFRQNQAAAQPVAAHRAKTAKMILEWLRTNTDQRYYARSDEALVSHIAAIIEARQPVAANPSKVEQAIADAVQEIVERLMAYGCHRTISDTITKHLGPFFTQVSQPPKKKDSK